MVIRVCVIMATFLVLSLAIPPFLMVYFIGQQMAQVWVMVDTLCFYVFFLLYLCVWRNWGRYTDFLRLSYGLLIVYLPAAVIGPPRTTVFVFVLHLTTVWAAGYLGFSLALHRVGMPKSTERDIDVLPACLALQAMERTMPKNSPSRSPMEGRVRRGVALDRAHGAYFVRTEHDQGAGHCLRPLVHGLDPWRPVAGLLCW
jgi:hypothetical protein